MLWIPITIGAAGFQVARNALQRGLMGDAGPWGATLVRFLFGLPFSIAVWAVVAALSPDARPNFGLTFWLAVSTGAMSQLLASASLLVAMRRAGFAIGTALQQSSLPLSALIGLRPCFHDNLRPHGLDRGGDHHALGCRRADPGRRARPGRSRSPARCSG